jgi:muramoyltetrapeptide carboxypeptidase
MLLIDPPNSAGHGRLWSHLASDTSYDELHAFAATLGIPRRGFDRDHYDIPAERYDEVVASGAVPVASRELIVVLTRAGLRRRKSQTLAPRRPGRPLLRAPRLRVGDRVAVVAPAGPVPPDRLEAGLAVLRSWGLDVVLGEHVVSGRQRFGYLAAEDSARAGDLMRAWCDPTVAAVVCARGGYGVHRMVDLLDWRVLAMAGPKVLVGFSDVTALHQAFAAHLGLSTVHGPVVTSLGAGDDESRDRLRSLLLDPTPGLSITPTRARTVVGGQADGVLVGGNLALVAAEAGTPNRMPAAGSIAVLEDVREPAYRLDRLLTQLLRSGWFDQVHGVVLGDFSGDLAGGVTPETLDDLARDRFGALGVPVVAGAAFGHAARNLAFPLGVRAHLDADAGSVVVTERPLR